MSEPGIRDVSFKVVNADDNPISGATVSIGTTTSTTGSAGGCTLKNITDGEHTVEVTCDGYDDYTGEIMVSETSTDFNIQLNAVTKMDTSIFGLDVNRAVENICPNTPDDNCLPSYQCLVVDENSIPLKKPVTVTFDGETHTLTPDTHGLCEFDLTGVAPGEYSITVEYAGDDTYKASSTTNTIQIFENKTDPGCKKFIKLYNGIPDFEQPVGDDNGVQVNIGDPWGNPATTTFIANGVEYIIPDDQLEGRNVELDISEFPAGTYYFIVYHKADEQINTANSNIWLVKGVLYD